MQPRIATRAPVLRPVAVEATAPQDRATLSESQSHTRTDSVLVLLRAGLPLSTISTGSRYTSCSRRRKPPRLVSTDAVLSAWRRGGRARAGRSRSVIWSTEMPPVVHCGRESQMCSGYCGKVDFVQIRGRIRRRGVSNGRRVRCIAAGLNSEAGEVGVAGDRRGQGEIEAVSAQRFVLIHRADGLDHLGTTGKNNETFRNGPLVDLHLVSRVRRLTCGENHGVRGITFHSADF
ncbi:hypothetical protein EYF80_034082 [Liparis tanakae]|uniref:Uncharacterized protein n=1 Tax=Liparis tanakae TaxID=230148 RepID=A0A4Z2GQ75_9TELE|nr:hypothetical protein EYF80_034082 [Liparis tanakae]